MIAYRLLTGSDDSSFCHKVSDALARGWALHGDPSYAFDQSTQTMRCAQAVIKDIPDVDYFSDLKLGAL
ncbi:MAG: DUF1737 domain-containing protein [Pseudomonadota bacterium]